MPTDNEIWREIPGFIGYEVSNRGRVRSYWKMGRYPELLDRPQRLMKQCINRERGNRPVVGIGSSNNSRKTFFVHTLVLIAFVGSCPPGYQCRHLDGDVQNNSAKNLTWGTQKENETDKIRHGTSQHGENNRSARLKREEVNAILFLYKNNTMTMREVGELFNVKPQTVSNIVHNKTWQNPPLNLRAG